jgi:hypothetical protein
VGGGGAAVTCEPMVRVSGVYAVFQGETYRAGGGVVDRTVNLWWRGSDRPPEGFELSEDGQAGVRTVDEAELDRRYNLTVTCGYRGGGPFRVSTVEQRDGLSPLLYVTYEGENREWALAQPGMAASDAV